MIPTPAPDLSALPPARRAALIYAQAQSELSTRLWRAALGDGDTQDRGDFLSSGPGGMSLDSLVGLLGSEKLGGATDCACCNAHRMQGMGMSGTGMSGGGTGTGGGGRSDIGALSGTPMRMKGGTATRGSGRAIAAGSFEPGGYGAAANALEQRGLRSAAAPAMGAAPTTLPSTPTAAAASIASDFVPDFARAEPVAPGIGTPVDLTPGIGAAASAVAFEQRGVETAAIAPGTGFGVPTVPSPAEPNPAPGTALTLGTNAMHGDRLTAASRRTGIPAPALAAIVNAESAKRADGSWNPLSRNPRSSAAGLGQFLSGTWEGVAEMKGTWLNKVAAARGWLDPRGQILPGARSEMLALRYDPTASIESVADLARYNLDQLTKSGFDVDATSETLAKAAYLCHHLGIGDTRRFLGDGIPPERARVLLNAQIGSASASERIERSGNATQAHRVWLLGYIQRNVQPEKFGA